MARRVRSRDGASTALLCDSCGSAPGRRLGMRYGATPAEALWRNACGSSLTSRCGSAAARRLRKHPGKTLAESL